MSFKSSNINKELKKILEEYRDSYQAVTEQSRNEYMKTLQPGQPVPKEGRIYTDQARTDFEKQCSKLRQKVHDLMSEQITDLKNKITEAPTSEAVNAITMLSMRKNGTEGEFSDMLDRYGENPQAYQTINSLARERGIYSFRDHPVYSELQSTEDLSRNLEKALTVNQAESGHATNGFLSFLGTNIDSTFPEE